MESKLVFSDSRVLSNYFRLVRLLLSSNRRKTFSGIKETIRLKLANKKLLIRLYKKLLKFKSFRTLLNSNLVLYYCLLKKYYLTYFSWFLDTFFSFRSIAFFVYHFLVLYRAIFLIKMALDWFPIKNWDRASPLKRFLRRATINWTREFEKYFPSIFAWLIVINIVPTFLYFIESFYVASDFARFPISYNSDEVLEFVLDSNNSTF